MSAPWTLAAASYDLVRIAGRLANSDRAGPAGIHAGRLWVQPGPQGGVLGFPQGSITH